ncbi:hypothetical protein [Coralloluteibacterium stylophorae]|uniref:Uncharacterized protein n=1 Tax=Coralloluteibacterium stylophorae TaxID=1776034 RepID=A0A8J7VQH4_9GAMM|nr:hypothetical protein [Coralloluteibacterium stylophorae]MBS7458138.1 hypothetical protein [Coralloluteibacterium stylophorae]
MSLVFQVCHDAGSRRWQVRRNDIPVERGLPCRDAALAAALVLAQDEQRRRQPHAALRIDRGRGLVWLETAAAPAADAAARERWEGVGLPCG